MCKTFEYMLQKYFIHTKIQKNLLGRGIAEIVSYNEQLNYNQEETMTERNWKQKMIDVGE